LNSWASLVLRVGLHPGGEDQQVGGQLQVRVQDLVVHPDYEQGFAVAAGGFAHRGLGLRVVLHEDDPQLAGPGVVLLAEAVGPHVAV
jgi:hypothetical protein